MEVGGNKSDKRWRWEEIRVMRDGGEERWKR